jgi:hypothetical protein
MEFGLRPKLEFLGGALSDLEVTGAAARVPGLASVWEYRKEAARRRLRTTRKGVGDHVRLRLSRTGTKNLSALLDHLRLTNGVREISLGDQELGEN